MTASARKPVRRLKTYTAETGSVYQYYFVGQRRALPGQAPGIEYIFDVSSGRKVTFAVSVFLHDRAVESWAATHGRPLGEAERYAAAKMRLLRGFDECPDLVAAGRSLLLDGELLDRLLAELGVD